MAKFKPFFVNPFTISRYTYYNVQTCEKYIFLQNCLQLNSAPIHVNFLPKF